jgi:ankyrin repeat protein
MIEFFVDSWEPALRVRSRSGQLPAHAAAHFAALDVVQSLGTRDPQMLGERTPQGYLPLHFAARNKALDVVSFFAVSGPQTLLDRTNGGLLCLHVAVKYGTLDVLRYLADSCPQAHPREGPQRVAAVALRRRTSRCSARPCPSAR